MKPENKLSKQTIKIRYQISFYKDLIKHKKEWLDRSNTPSYKIERAEKRAEILILKSFINFLKRLL